MEKLEFQSKHAEVTVITHLDVNKDKNGVEVK
jgi:hypothetical protein